MHLSRSDVVVRISDNGKGIQPQIPARLTQAIQASDKAHGQGLGLLQARQMTRRAGGALKIGSTVEEGTFIDFVLPKIRPPKWLLPLLELTSDSVVVTVDDDRSVHDVWTFRLKEHVADGRLLHFQNPAGFIRWFDAAPDKASIVVLTDYEFIGHALNGLDVCLR